MQKKKRSTVDIAEELALPVAQELGLSLWDVRFEKEGSVWFLRYFIDKDGGVNIGDCEAFSRRMDKLLDQADPIDQSYTLEVSSPGIQRQLTRERHFRQCIGYEVTLLLIRPVDGVRQVEGTLHSYQDGRISLSLKNGELFSVEAAETAYVRLVDADTTSTVEWED